MNDVWAFDFSTLSWTPIASQASAEAADSPLPPIAGHSLIPWQNSLLVVGGHVKVERSMITTGCDVSVVQGCDRENGHPSIGFGFYAMVGARDDRRGAGVSWRSLDDDDWQQDIHFWRRGWGTTSVERSPCAQLGVADMEESQHRAECASHGQIGPCIYILRRSVSSLFWRRFDGDML